jgi:hypothetical protein
MEIPVMCATSSDVLYGIADSALFIASLVALGEVPSFLIILDKSTIRGSPRRASIPICQSFIPFLPYRFLEFFRPLFVIRFNPPDVLCPPFLRWHCTDHPSLAFPHVFDGICRGGIVCALWAEAFMRHAVSPPLQHAAPSATPGRFHSQRIRKSDRRESSG